MSKSKSPSLPEAPKIDPVIGQASGSLLNLGNKLTNFDFTGSLSPLADTISLDPEVTKLALSYAQNSLTPAFNDTLNQIRNEAANAGALESSTFTDAITKAGQNLDSQFQSIVSGAALDDRTRALNNRVNLFGTGLNTIQSAGGLSNNINQFNLENYNNQVAAALSGQKQSNGGFLGGALGAVGGGLAAAGLGVTNPLLLGASVLGGGVLGGAGTQSTGGSLLQTGAGIFGSSFRTPTGTAPFIPGSSASNDPFKNRVGGYLSNNPYALSNGSVFLN